MQEVFPPSGRLSRSDISVLITGETAAAKRWWAGAAPAQSAVRAVHRHQHGRDPAELL